MSELPPPIRVEVREPSADETFAFVIGDVGRSLDGEVADWLAVVTPLSAILDGSACDDSKINIY